MVGSRGRHSNKATSKRAAFCAAKRGTTQHHFSSNKATAKRAAFCVAKKDNARPSSLPSTGPQQNGQHSVLQRRANRRSRNKTGSIPCCSCTTLLPLLRFRKLPLVRAWLPAGCTLSGQSLPPRDPGYQPHGHAAGRTHPLGAEPSKREPGYQPRNHAAGRLHPLGAEPSQRDPGYQRSR